MLDFDMLQTGHGGAWHAFIGNDAGVALNTVAKVTSHYSKTPTMLVLVGEVTYEGHMRSNGPEIQRFRFWSSMLNGAAGHTYGGGGIWQMNLETDRGAEYECAPWFEAMQLPGSTQLGLGKTLLEELPLVMQKNPNIVPAVEMPETTVLAGGDDQWRRFPAPQDWVLVMTRLQP